MWVKIDYKNASGNISEYYPDFIVKKSEKEIFIIETKGREDLDVPLKTQRLKQWCEDLNKSQKKVKYNFIYVDEESFKKYKPFSFEQLERNFRKYKN
jgi:type III restriction enzyme